MGVTSQKGGLCFRDVIASLAEFDGVNRFGDRNLCLNLPLVPLALANQVVGLRGRDGLLHSASCPIFKGEVTFLDTLFCRLGFARVEDKSLAGWCLKHCS